MSDRKYLVCLGVLALVFALIGKLAQAGSSTYNYPLKPGETWAQSSNCSFFADNWFELGQCHATPVPWDHDIRKHGSNGENDEGVGNVSRPEPVEPPECD